ncbi:MAG: methylated-DNA-[protein]-cysteine S-methyltransferase [Algoriphagus sp.]|jgi:methylated-DNA-[protein]-cysteine S-methyltransferase
MPIISSPLGNIFLSTQDDSISELRFTTEEVSKEPLNSLLSEAKKQLDDYFSGTRKTFNLPVVLSGTPFQYQVWEAVNKIPFGQTTSYLKLSQALGNPAAIRAVGAAIGANPILVIIPCHRIIGTNGQLTGYAGGLDRKEKLLELEGRPRQPKQASLDF